MSSSTYASSYGDNKSALRDAFENLRSNKNDIFLLDGGTGEELFRRGVPDDRKIWSATALVHSEHHNTLEQAHASFLKAGSQAVTTNSYGVVPGVGFNSEDITKYIGISGKIARQAVTKNGGLVFGSLGPLVESYRADMIKDHVQGVSDYEIACKALIPHVDAFLAETMSCVEESSQAIEAVSNVGNNCPMLVSYTLDPKGNFRDNQNITEGLKQVMDFAEKKKVEQPESITLALARIAADSVLSNRLQASGVFLGAYANRLTQVDPNWTLQESEMPQPFRVDLDEKQYWEDFVKLWIGELNVKLVGGCCGITPEHIAYIRSELEKRQK